MIQKVRKINCLMFCVLLLSTMFINSLDLQNKASKSNLKGKTNNSSTQDQSKLDKAIFAGGLVKSCMKALVDSMAPDFCWKDGGDVGKIPQGCPEGYFRHLALCYERCRGRYQYNGAGLCVDGWNSYIPSSITNFSDRATCGEGYYKSGALCYKDCENIGMFNCGIGACTSSKASCGMQIASMAIDTVVGAGQFVAFVLSMGASSAATPQVNAGRQATRQLTRQVTQTAWAKVKTSLNSFLKQTIQRAKKAFIDNIKDLPLGMSAEWAAENLCTEIYNGVATVVNGKAEPSSTDPVEVLKKFDIFGVAPIVENCGDSNKKAECAKAILNTASTFDPTGLLTISAAFVHPTCTITMPGDNRKDPKSLQNKPKSTCKNCHQMMRTLNDYGAGHLIFLDRHNVECPAGSALNYVYVSQQGGNIGFDYRCIKDNSITSQCRDEYTQWDDFSPNDGSVQFLDRHNVECSSYNNILQKFQLQTNWNNKKVRFSYRCCMVNGYNYTNDYRTLPTLVVNDWRTNNFNSNDAIDAGSFGALKGLKLRTDYNPGRLWFEYKVSSWNGTGSSIANRETGWNDAGQGSVWFLDRHHVSCSNNNSAIRAFWYQRGGENFRYNYECVTHPKISNTCETRYTKLSDLDWNEYKSINFLDRQQVFCYGDESMKSFKVQRIDNRLRYEINCCKTEFVSDYKTRWEKTDMGGKQNYYLDRQKIVLGVDEALRGFWMEVSYNPDLIWYAWHANVLN
jgi:hypothetical protein